MDIRNALPPPPTLPTAVLPALDPTGTSKGANTPDELKKTSEDFAAMLYSEMFSSMRSEDDDEEGSIFGGQKDTGMFMSFFDQALGQKYAARGGEGVSEQLYQNFAKGRTPGS